MSHPARGEPAQPDHDGHFIMIALDKEKFAIFGKPDAGLVLNGKAWTATPANTLTWYAQQGGGVKMHNLIAGYTGVDHANRNGLDNRRINLRPATRSQQRANCPPSRRNTSGYKGVRRARNDRKWAASIMVDGRLMPLGRFDDPVEAARAYNRAAFEAFGEYAWLNPV